MVNRFFDHMFFRIDGKNGASFFFSSASSNDWRRSLEFYRAVSAAAKAKKVLLKLAYPLLKRRSLLNASGVARLIAAELGMAEAPAMDEHTSAMISPTRDKALVHHHGRSFEKFASGGSFSGVSRELEIYHLLAERSPRTFAFSRLLDEECGSGTVRFEMAYAPGNFRDAPPALTALIAPLAEFFSLSEPATRPWAELWLSVGDPADIPDKYRTGTAPVGLAHRDFKPWNVKGGKLPLFFDFESASMDGCPLEDLFNYRIDPLLRSRRVRAVAETARRELFPLAERLLSRLGIPAAELPRYWCWYLRERSFFWRKCGRSEFAKRFDDLYEVAR